jgi:serine/threonine protein kinase
MTMTLEQFVSLLDESGVISAEDIAVFQQSHSHPVESAEDLGKLLIKHKKVTKLQARMVYQGKGDRLRLGNYIVLDKIGAGGMGDVYLAEHRRMERRVALKTLPAAMTQDTQSIQRFQREVKAAAKLTHPNIVTAYDADEANGVHYFVMEYVKGIDLSAVVKQQGVLSVGKALDYILQAAQGLEYAHRKGVIHRDIKPANLLLDKEGTIKILDMGLARIEDAAHEIPATQLTQDGSVMGTVDYMAPEQAQDTHSADARSDIYSLGCSLYYLLTGESVFTGTTVVNRIMAHQNEPIPSLTDRQILSSHDVDAIFQKMIAKQPGDRFQSMQQVINAIEHCDLQKDSATDAVPSDPELHKFLQSRDIASSPTISMATGKPLYDNSGSDFLNKTLNGTAYQPLQKRRKPAGKRGWVVAGVLLASLLLMAGFIFKPETPPGTSSLEVNQPGMAGAVATVDQQQERSRKNSENPQTTTGSEPQRPAAENTRPVIKSGYIWPQDQPAPAIAPFNPEEARQYQSAWASYLGVAVETTNSLGMPMRVIPPGEFLMGTSDKEIVRLREEQEARSSNPVYIERIPNEGPQHAVVLTKPVRIAIHEVTRGQFRKFVDATGHQTEAEKNDIGGFGWKDGKWVGSPEFSWKSKTGFELEQTDNHPVVNISWNDAMAFCAWLSEQEGVDYRLPTEAEWEYACRAGSLARYSFGDDHELMELWGWCGSKGGGGPRPIGQKRSNAFGLFDLHGNATEWCASKYTPYTAMPEVDPQGLEKAKKYTLRGGCYLYSEWIGRAAFRAELSPTVYNHYTGFRIVQTLEKPEGKTN